jgi:hypothetical protein
MERIMKKIMMLFTCIAATCWNSGAIDIEAMHIPDEDEKLLSAFKLRDGMSVKEFYKRALSGKISGNVELNFITCDKNNNINVVGKRLRSFLLATFTVFLRYSMHPNPMTLEDMLRFACSFAPLIYWELANHEMFDQVATSECTCGNFHVTSDKTTFVGFPSRPIHKNDPFWDSGDSHNLKFFLTSEREYLTQIDAK